MSSRPLAVALAAAVLCAVPARADHDTIDEAFVKVAPEVLKHVRACKANNVGVLKFLVQRPGGKLDDTVGELNLSLADRLEAALILENKDRTFGILGRPSTAVVADNNRWANHLTPEGRQAFFKTKYNLAWGSVEDKVKAAMFVTGTATLSKDLRSVSITLEAFGPDGESKPIGTPMSVATSRRTLVEAGYSYVLTEKAAPQVFDGSRGGGSKGVRQKAKDEDEVASLGQALAMNDPTKTEGVKSTAEEAIRECPVKLTVLYNGTEVPIERDGIREPAETDKVAFRLTNTDTKRTYAVVLKVNGKNTLFSEELDADRCLKWILAPGATHDIRGFQEDETQSVPFKILSNKESEKGQVRYGDLVGMMRMVVYRGELSTGDVTPAEQEEPESRQVVLAAVSRGAQTKSNGGRPGSLARLQAVLKGLDDDSEGARGIIDKGGKKEASPLQRVQFTTLPSVGVADITLRYYTPKKG